MANILEGILEFNFEVIPSINKDPVFGKVFLNVLFLPKGGVARLHQL
jgi:hypothetical protein